jgi:hypothetical protein
MTFELLNPLSSSKMYLLLYKPSILGSRIVRRIFLPSRVIGSLSFLSAPTLQCRTTEPSGSRSCRSFTLSDVPSEITADVSQASETPISSLDPSLYLLTHVVIRCHKNSQVQKFVDDFKTHVAKSHSSSGVENHPISSRNKYFVFCSLIFSPSFAASASNTGIADGF